MVFLYFIFSLTLCVMRVQYALEFTKIKITMFVNIKKIDIVKFCADSLCCQ